ncbi:MAG: hypothetical protein O7B81_09150 [Gammaproteobacteria bacterium]|nr:hypothetical protein [Gammaproteobacteria bacterium]
MSAAPATARAVDIRLAIGLVAALLLAALVLGHYHDRFWWAPDDGADMHMAERLLAGEVMHRDIHDVHPGYHNFLNAAALWLFGDDFVSLRYPRVVMGLVQAGLLFLLLGPRGAIVGVAGALGGTALSFVQFLNPTANWHALFVYVVIVCALAWLPRECRWRLAVLGFLIGTLVMFRQLTGVIVAIGVVAWLLVEPRPGAREAGGSRALARALVLIMLAGLAGYLLGKTNRQAIGLFGVWPLAVLVWAWFNLAACNRAVAHMVLWLSAGAIAAAVPLAAYHLANGSVANWLDDVVIGALSLSQLDFMRADDFGYALFLIYALRQVAMLVSAAEVVNGLFWIALLSLATAQGVLVLRGLMRAGTASPAFHPLPFIGVFYALVAVHFQTPVYLFFSTGPAVAALLWLTTGSTGWRRWSPVAFALALSAVALHYHAAQPLTRGIGGVLRGERVALATDHGLDRVSLSIEPDEAALYAHFVDLIAREAPAGAPILALPMNPELYVLARRRNPLRFFNAGMGLVDAADVAEALEVLERDPPALVFHRPRDKYNTPLTARIVEFVRDRYTPIESIKGFDVYRYRAEN